MDYAYSLGYNKPPSLENADGARSDTDREPSLLGAHRVKGSAQVVIIVAVIVAIFKPGVPMLLHRAARHVPRQAVQVLKQQIRP